MNRKSFAQASAATWLSLSLLSACTVGPDFHAPDAPEVSRYTRGEAPVVTAAASGPGGAAQTFETTAHAPRTWWTQFNSPALNALVDEALRASPTLDAARARLVEAQENYNAQAGATLFPSVGITLSGSRQKIDLASLGITAVPNPGPFSLFNASVSVSYLLDIFGVNRRALEATLAQVNYRAYELEAARLSLAGNVVAAAIRRASLQRQIELTQQLVDAQARQLGIMSARYAAGGVSQLDVRSQRTLLAQMRALLPPLKVQLAQSEHQLAILLGKAPASAQFDDITLNALHLPEKIALTLPSALARERPDIRASEALLHEASANVGVATANLYPQLSISASVSSERMQIHDLLDSLNVWNAGLGITQPIFRGGELRAKRRAAQAAYTAALADYRLTVLQALQQVADALQAVQDDALALQSCDVAAREALASADIARERYAVGGISEFSLIDAQRQALQTTLDRTRAQASRLADTVALYQALGGAALPGEAGSEQ